MSGPVTVGATPVTVDLTTRRNFADVTAPQGRHASVAATNFRDETAAGCGPAKLFDSDQGTAVDTTAPTDTDDPATPEHEDEPRFITLELAQPVRAAEIWIDPTAHCGELVGSSLGTYEVEVSADGVTFTDVSHGTFGLTDLQRLNRVPLDTGAAMPANVRYVRLTAFRSIGGPDEEGDPLSDGGFLGVSELQVYDATPVVATPTPQPTVSPTPTPTVTPTPTPTPAARLRPSLARTPKRLKVSARRRVTVKVACLRAGSGRLPARCRVKLALSHGIAHRTVTIRTGRTVSVRLTIRRATFRTLRRHSVRARLTAATGGRTAAKRVRLR